MYKRYVNLFIYLFNIYVYMYIYIYIYMISRACTVTLALRTPSARVQRIMSQHTTLEQYRSSDNETHFPPPTHP